jgi:hypothetical protein
MSLEPVGRTADQCLSEGTQRAGETPDSENLRLQSSIVGGSGAPGGRMGRSRPGREWFIFVEAAHGGAGHLGLNPVRIRPNARVRCEIRLELEP